MSQHSTLSPERWARFRKSDQILMIANELHRARGFLGPGEGAHLLLSYERTLRLVDLTIEVQAGRGLRKELLRWRDLIAGLIVAPAPDPAAHAEALEALLGLDPEAYRQIPLLFPNTG